MKALNIKDRLKKQKNKKWYFFLNQLICGIKEDEVTAVGAQLTYYLILSIFPFLIFFLNILSYTSITQENLFNGLDILLPQETQKLLQGIINEIAYSSSDTLLSLSFLLTLWTGSLGITAIIKAINKAYNVKKKRPYWRLKAIAIIFTVALALLLIIVLGMLVFGELIGNKIFGLIGATNIFIHLWEKLRIVIPLMSMIIIFALLYKFSPTPEEGIHLKIRHTLPGAIFTTIGWVIASMIFSYYVNNFGKYSKTYGSLGGIIVLLIWLYIASIMIVLGGEINGAYAATMSNKGINECGDDEKK
ncbi:YihY/virulence factor BrkB family protein [Tepidimicrobium xylanilyticum]|uniref:Membrane protein n=1 Tax=Tepidimicrobium xylanilyticum TaxID=1123352 RepID=A0A1H2QJ13_9FIRM|nr:YihY/virulence factor BrkB family protein [Tepidimicrobium xylanilyticum]GMG95646.1 hypothetical protein EN5CB1_04720 [Tepidimicrobium xylanilyticum]SDW07152.1 membrane protein [Tepidimicrobium xylanilyticum]